MPKTLVYVRKVVMGFRKGLFLRAVLLFSCGNLCAVTQNQFNVSSNEILDQMPHVKTSLEVSTSPQTTNQQRDSGRYQLRSNRLRSPALNRQKPLEPLVEPSVQSLHGPEAGGLTSDQLASMETGLDLEQLPGQLPDLSSPVEQKSKVVVQSEQRASADSVAVHCGEGEVTLRVNQNFLGNGQLIRPGDLTLGGCAALHTADHILQFRAELHSCGSTTLMTEDTLIYTFSLMYFPTPIGNTFILKTNPAEVLIECRYRRRQYVSSNTVRPTWKPFASNVLAEQQLHFSLSLMAEDWTSQRASSVYNLSDVMHVEVSVLNRHHVPLRVYADSCVATVTPDPNSQPRYAFVGNHGCLTDAKLTGAKSYFMQRSREDKLHFQLKAFRFHQDPRNSLYITCLLKATTVSVPISSEHKACSFLTEADRWVASGGDNKVCGCCETSCGEQRRKRSLPADVVEGRPADLQWLGTDALGPVLLDNILRLTELSEHPPKPVSRVAIRASSHPSMALLCGGVAVLAVMLAFMCRHLHQSTQTHQVNRLICGMHPCSN